MDPELTLSAAQFSIASNAFSFTIATFLASALFFFLGRSEVAPKYRVALMMSGLVVSIACYHYFRIYESWGKAFELNDGTYSQTGSEFNDAYRYADWILTVPLLLAELVAVLALPKGKGGGLLARLVVAALAMIALGYPGEINRGADGSAAMYWIFFGLSMLPFLYILFVLFTEFSAVKKDQPERIQGYMEAAKWIIVVTWSFYPVAYLVSGSITGAAGEVGMQVGYTLADVVAKAGYGLFIFQIARVKSEIDGYYDTSVQTPTSPSAATV